MTVDARGLSCPEPVVRAQQALKNTPEEATILVDAMAAVENITRFANSRGYALTKTEDNGEYTLVLKKI